MGKVGSIGPVIGRSTMPTVEWERNDFTNIALKRWLNAGQDHPDISFRVMAECVTHPESCLHQSAFVAVVR